MGLDTVAVSFLFVLGLIALTTYVLKRYVPFLHTMKGPTSAIEVVTRMSLDPKRSIHVVRYKNLEYVLLVSSEGHLHLSTEEVEEKSPLKKEARP
jgi:flagellar biosynthetic protein FliO